MSNASILRGVFLQVESLFHLPGDSGGRRCRRPKALIERETGIAVDQVDHLALAAPLWRTDLDLASLAFREPASEQLLVLEGDRDVDLQRNERSIHVEEFQQGTKELFGLEPVLVLPEKLLLVDDPPTTHVKRGNSDEGTILLIPEDVDIVEPDRRHLLSFRDLFDRPDGVPVVGRGLVLLGAGGLFHFPLQPEDKFPAFPFEKHLDVAHRIRILFSTG